MIGAIIGDVIGSLYEFAPILHKDFPLFTNNHNLTWDNVKTIVELKKLKSDSHLTDDSILTMAVFCALDRCDGNYEELYLFVAEELIKWSKKYPFCGFGRNFNDWVMKCSLPDKICPPYNSCGNGSAMRVSPVAYFAKDLEDCKKLSAMVTQITHNHPEGIMGAEATAVATFMALNGAKKEEIFNRINTDYYELKETIADIKTYYKYDMTCQGTVPQALQAFFEANSFEDTVRNGVNLCGDADTICAIAGAVAEAYYGIPKEIEDKLDSFLDDYCRPIVKRINEFRNNKLNEIKIIKNT